MKRYLFSLALLIISASTVLSQNGHSLLLNASGMPTTILVGSNTGGTYTFPDGGGILVTSGSIPSVAWVLVGNALTGGTPATPVEFFGSTNNYDVVMKANNVEKLRLVAGGGVT